MTLDPELSATGVGVGFLVGLTGMGGGALMTPLLILVFGVPPMAAVSSDLVTSLLMKPFGAAVHLRRRTVDWHLVRWLTTGAAPAAFAGVLLLRLLGHGRDLQAHLKVLIGAVLLLSLAASLAGGLLRRANHAGPRPQVVRTLVIGAVGGLCVGMTSVGAGSVILTLLLLTHPGMTASRLVGTDLVQAIPLVAAATVGHVLFGDVRVTVTLSLAAGAIPGVYLGARMSSRAPAGALKPVIVAVLLASALALVHVSTPVLLGVSGCYLVLRLASAGVRRLSARAPMRLPAVAASTGGAEES